MASDMEPESELSISKRRRQKLRIMLIETVFALLFGGSIFAARYLSDLGSSPILWVGAIVLPAMALTIWFVYAANRILRLDEFERSLAVNSFAIAAAIVIWLGTIWSLSASYIGVASFPMILIAPVATAIWQCVWWILSARYS